MTWGTWGTVGGRSCDRDPGMLKVGDPAPPIDALASNGNRFVLDEQPRSLHRHLLLPQSVHARLHRRDQELPQERGARSRQRQRRRHQRRRAQTQCRFADSLGVPFPIIGEDRSISRAYDVLWPLVGLARRVTYVVGPRPDGAPGRVVEAVFHHELRVSARTDDVLPASSTRSSAEPALGAGISVYDDVASAPQLGRAREECRYFERARPTMRRAAVIEQSLTPDALLSGALPRTLDRRAITSPRRRFVILPRAIASDGATRQVRCCRNIPCPRVGDQTRMRHHDHGNLPRALPRSALIGRPRGGGHRVSRRARRQHRG